MGKTVKNENIFHGRGSLKNLLDIMEDECAHNLLLISGKKSSKSTGLKSQLDALLKDKNSILVKFDDDNGWVKAILKLQNIFLREKLANKALNDFYKYSWHNRVKKVLKQP